MFLHTTNVALFTRAIVCKYIIIFLFFKYMNVKNFALDCVHTVFFVPLYSIDIFVYNEEKKQKNYSCKFNSNGGSYCRYSFGRAWMA